MAHDCRSSRLCRLFAEREFDELQAAYIMNDADLAVSAGGRLDHGVSAAKASPLGGTDDAELEARIEAPVERD